MQPQKARWAKPTALFFVLLLAGVFTIALGRKAQASSDGAEIEISSTGSGESILSEEDTTTQDGTNTQQVLVEDESMDESTDQDSSATVVAPSDTTESDASQLVSQEDCPVVEVQGSNNAYTATAISLGRQVSNVCDNYQSQNWYKFYVPQNGYISITFESDWVSRTYNGWYIRLFKPSDLQYPMNQDFFQGGGVVPQTFRKYGLPVGTYYLQITPSETAGTRYRFTVNHTSSTTWELENNGSPNIANEISLGSTRYGNINGKADGSAYYDLDCYRLLLKEPASVQFSIGSQRDFDPSEAYFENNLREFECRVLNASQVGTSNSLAYMRCYGGSTSDATKTLSLPAGTYYIIISAGGGGGGYTSSSSYHISVKQANSVTHDTNGNQYTVPATPHISYRTHVQRVGWQKYVADGAMSGTSGRSLRLEGINIRLSDLPYTGGIQYRTHVQRIGWQGWRKDGKMAGTSGKSYRLEAIEIKLYGEMANRYDIYYRVHCQRFGWMGWAKNGQRSGSAGYSRRLEGIQIVLVPKGQPGPGHTYNGISQRYTSPFKQKGK